jgi:uncharacterized damage-inducible protein DinB
MAVENIIGGWQEVRSGLIDEAAQIPADQFSFQPAANTRSIKQLLQHLVESQKLLIGEACRPDTKFDARILWRANQTLRAGRQKH